jgi:hypothetical protein
MRWSCMVFRCWELISAPTADWDDEATRYLRRIGNRERERTLEWMELRTLHPGKVQASEAAAEDGDSSALLRVGICSYRPNE